MNEEVNGGGDNKNISDNKKINKNVVVKVGVLVVIVVAVQKIVYIITSIKFYFNNMYII